VAEDLTELIEAIQGFVAERDWDQFHDPKSLAMLVASEAGELLAEYRWIRTDEADAHTQDDEARARVEAEIADVGISLLLLCNRLDIDLPEAIRKKLEVNRRNYPPDLARGNAERHPRPS